MPATKQPGRPIAVKANPRDVRAILRRHLREEGKRLRDLAPVWGTRAEAVYVWFNDRAHPIAPARLEATIEFLRLDEFDAQELRLMGAIEAGWQLDMGMVA